MTKLLSKFRRDDSGATAIEYGLIAAGISVVIIVAVGTIGDNVSSTFNDIATGIGDADYTSTSDDGT